ITRIVEEFVAAGETVHVVTALPWYRTHSIEEGWAGRLVRREKTPWGSIIRVHPFPGKSKSNLLRRAVGFGAFSVLAGVCTLFAGGIHRRPAAVISMSPPLTLGLTGWVASRLRRCPSIFNIQDVFPDAAVETGAITNKRIIAVARWLERVSYHRSDAVVVLSDDLKANVVAKVSPRFAYRVHVIPNFVDVDRIVPMDRMTSYRSELGIGNEQVVMYAGNVGYSQSLGMLLHAARHLPDVSFVVNGDGSARRELEEEAQGLPNVFFSGYQPRERVAEVLASADLHVVPLRAGLGAVSVPSKTYSILAAARPVVAAIDAGTEVTRILAESGAGVAVTPDDPHAFTDAIRHMLADPSLAQNAGLAGRHWVETHVSPSIVATSYLAIVADLGV
ncbi:MAG: glycosyltransferase, partial [Actinobacteria bacterium]|nr:glycosyltransferase [Actinomycetota bacterium]